MGTTVSQPLRTTPKQTNSFKSLIITGDNNSVTLGGNIGIDTNSSATPSTAVTTSPNLSLHPGSGLSTDNPSLIHVSSDMCILTPEISRKLSKLYVNACSKANHYANPYYEQLRHFIMLIEELVQESSPSMVIKKLSSSSLSVCYTKFMQVWRSCDVCFLSSEHTTDKTLEWMSLTNLPCGPFGSIVPHDIVSTLRRHISTNNTPYQISSITDEVAISTGVILNKNVSSAHVAHCQSVILDSIETESGYNVHTLVHNTSKYATDIYICKQLICALCSTGDQIIDVSALSYNNSPGSIVLSYRKHIKLTRTKNPSSSPYEFKKQRGYFFDYNTLENTIDATFNILFEAHLATPSKVGFKDDASAPLVVEQTITPYNKFAHSSMDTDHDEDLNAILRSNIKKLIASDKSSTIYPKLTKDKVKDITIDNLHSYLDKNTSAYDSLLETSVLEYNSNSQTTRTIMTNPSFILPERPHKHRIINELSDNDLKSVSVYVLGIYENSTYYPNPAFGDPGIGDPERVPIVVTLPPKESVKIGIWCFSDKPSASIKDYDITVKYTDSTLSRYLTLNGSRPGHHCSASEH